MNKKLLTILTTILVLIVGLITSSAADNEYLGDIDNNGTITAADARAILRFSAKLDEFSAEQEKSADVDGNGIVNAADARITLRISAKLEKIEDYIKDSETTTETPITEDTEEPTTEEPTTEEPTTEEPTTEEPTTEEPTTEEPTTEEPTTEEPTTEEPTTEEPTTEEPTTEEPSTTTNSPVDSEYTTIDGIIVNTLPFSKDGITITSFSYSNGYDKVDLTVRNDSGTAIDSLSNIAYKCYDDNGTVLKTGSVFLEDLNSGESCNVYFYAEDNTTKILFGEGKVYEGENTDPVSMTAIDGINVNVLPYTANGLTITAFSYSNSYDKVELTVRNDTGTAIDSLSNIAYKCYDDNGTVLKTGSVSLEDLNSGESCNVYFYAEDNTTKIVFGEGKVYD